MLLTNERLSRREGRLIPCCRGVTCPKPPSDDLALAAVAAAKTAIFQRLQQISQSSDDQAERQAIEDAMAGLRILKRDSLGFPDWGKK
jgi:hypothetical protein